MVIRQLTSSIGCQKLRAKVFGQHHPVPPAGAHGASRSRRSAAHALAQVSPMEPPVTLELETSIDARVFCFRECRPAKWRGSAVPHSFNRDRRFCARPPWSTKPSHQEGPAPKPGRVPGPLATSPASRPKNRLTRLTVSSTPKKKMVLEQRPITGPFRRARETHRERTGIVLTRLIRIRPRPIRNDRVSCQ